MEKKTNVLGIEVSDIRPDRAVNTTIEYMQKKGIQTIFFLTANSSLYCQTHVSEADLVNSSELVLPGDSQIERTISKHISFSSGSEGICKFADDYFSRLFSRLNRERKFIFAVMESQENLDHFKDYAAKFYPELLVEGYVFDDEEGILPDSVVNEINASIPDIVMLCISPVHQMLFMSEYKSMMNTRLLLCIESFGELIQKESYVVPGWIQSLGLDDFYRWLKKEQKLQRTIINSIFNSKVKDVEYTKEEVIADDDFDDEKDSVE